MLNTTACVIVRNEEKNLPRWLRCMKKLADEMVIVDTGSTDKTVELARLSGARVFSFPWINDFAAAKNFAIDKARGKWIFLLDADEYWEDKDFSLIRKTLRDYEKKAHIIGFVCNLVNIDADHDNRVLNESMHIRIMRNLPGLRYVGAIHEQLVYKGAGQGQKEMVLLPKARIYHTGYSPSTDTPKARRNLEILLAQQQAGTGQPGDICYIADCYYSLKDYNKAAEAATAAIAAKEILPGRETRMYSTLIQSKHLLGIQWSKLLPLVEEAEKAFPYVPDFRALLGFAAWEEGARAEARRFFRESKELYKDFLAHREDVTATYPDEMAGFLPKIEACLQEGELQMMTDKTPKVDTVRVSAAVITKNEEENLPTWLNCMQALADEIIVVDTGSTDNTVEIAKAAGARVVHFDWIDDFAAAKNFAIDQTRGRWILLLDADEYILPRDYAGVRAAIDRYDGDDGVIGLASDWINVNKAKNNAYIGIGYQIRVFKKLPELRYTRMIHELLQYRGEGRKTMPYVDDFKIYHTGYSSGRMPEKFRRNLRLLLLSAEKYGHSPEDDMYLADCYYGLKEYEKAIEHARAYLDGGGRSAGGENRPFGLWIQAMMLLKKPMAEILPVIRRAREEMPYSAEFCFQEGFIRYEAQDYIGAEACYLKGLEVYAYAKEHNEWKKNLLTDEAAGMLLFVYLDMCRLYLWQGKRAEAWEFLQRALGEDRYKSDCLKLLGVLMQDKDDVEWIEVINRLYDKETDAGFLLACLPRKGRDKVRLYYMRGLQTRPAEKYMLAGRLEAAGASLCEDTAALLQIGIRGFAHKEINLMEKIGAFMPAHYRAVSIGQGKTITERRLAEKTAQVQNWLSKCDGSVK